MKYTHSFYKFTQISCLRVWYIMSNNNFDLDILIWMGNFLLKLICFIAVKKAFETKRSFYIDKIWV